MDGRRLLPLIMALLLLVADAGAAEPSEADVLLKFKTGISDEGGSLKSWVAGSAPCNKNVNNWADVICDNRGGVSGLRLEGMNLAGAIDVDVLLGLRRLRTLSISDNDFEGPMPELGKLMNLRALYLSGNRFSGEIPGRAFAGMRWLRKLHLSDNAFSGSIPASIAELPRLIEVGLDDNEFGGAIPDFQSKELAWVNLANNNLEGSIPESLRGMKPTLFAGNKGLCGEPLAAPCPPAASPTPSSSPAASPEPLTPETTATPPSSSSSHSSRVAISIVAVIALVVIAFIVWQHRDTHPGRSAGRRKYAASKEAKLEEGTRRLATASNASSMRRAGKDLDHGRLVFVRENRRRFELLDLLRAQAEVLGNGGLGCSYKAALANGSAVVVKRFKHMNKMGREDFEEHMRRMGRLSHPNLLPLVSYYYRKDEKLMITDYVPTRNLADAIHGSNDTYIPPLDWSTRIRIVKGITRALNYLYEELQMLSVPHGHLKSSNVLLSVTLEPLLSDYALVPVMNHAHATQFMVAYKSPEFKEQETTSKKSDVWSLGLLILEIVTGKMPDMDLQQLKEGLDLASWVSSVAQEDWADKVLDSKMMVTEKGEEEMIELLQIGLACCAEDVEKRCELEEALDRIEEIEDREGYEDVGTPIDDSTTIDID